MDMNWNEIVAFVLSNLLKVVVALVIPYVVSLIIKKFKNDEKGKLAAKYVQIAADVVSKCVSYVDQIYVDNLKEDGMFNAEAQKTAFQMCKQRIILMLNEEAKNAVIEMYGDFENWLTNAIEASVRENKFSFISAAPEEGE